MPSLATESSLDSKLKIGLIKDIFKMVGSKE